MTERSPSCPFRIQGRLCWQLEQHYRTKALASTTDVLLYDLPGQGTGMERTLLKIDRFGRKARLNIHVLVPSNADSYEFESLKILREFNQRA